MNRRERISGLLGLRLALYDEALSAGQRGLDRAELLATVADEALRMGMRPESQAAAVDWLLEAGWIAEYTTGRYRARAKEDVMAEAGASSEGYEPRYGGTNSQEAQHKALAPKETPAVAQLRTPVFAPRQARGGQGTFF